MRAKSRLTRTHRILGRAIACCVESLESRRLLSAAVIYVDQSAPGLPNGSSWDNAFTDLQSALTAAQKLKQTSPVTSIVIDVAQGFYVPSATGDPTATFSLMDNVSLEGGFGGQTLASAGGDPSARSAYNYTTVLSGDIDGDESSLHVVTADNVDSSAVLYGFTISGGDAQTGVGAGVYVSHAAPTIAQCTFIADTAADGGAVGSVDSSPAITYCTFTDNTAAEYGGAVFSITDLSGDGSSPSISNCAFIDNSAIFGGAIAAAGSAPAIAQCAFVEDQAQYGGAIDFAHGASGSVSYSSFNSDSAQFGGAMNSNDSDPLISYCTFQGDSAGDGGAIADSASTGLTSNCTFTGNYADSGGAIYNIQSSPTIDNSTFTGNFTLSGDGGAIENLNCQDVTLSKCTFDGDATPQNGGAIDNGPHAAVTVSYCTFTSNTATEDGGAISNQAYSSPQITHSYFTANFASTGGAIDNQPDSNPAIEDCAFAANTASGNGGAIYNSARFITIAQCTFAGDSSTNGAAIATDDSSPIIVNCIFDAEYARTAGSAVYNDTSSVTIDNCTIVYCIAGAEGGAVALSSSGSPTSLANCIIWGDGPDLFAGSPAQVTFSDIDKTAYAGASGNIDQIPLFDSSTDLQLQPTSPCINAGKNADIPAGVVSDLAGNPRIFGIAVDMGAYEAPLGFVTSSDAAYNFSLSSSGQIIFNVTAGAITLGVSLSPSLQNFILDISGSARVVLAADQTLDGLSITGNGTLDIGTHSVTINYGVGNPSPLKSVQDDLALGYKNGAWNGTGIISSAAAVHPAYSVGYADGSVDSGTPALPGQVLIKYTLSGDANLDGAVNFNDLFPVGQRLNATGHDWTTGCFTYAANGAVDFNDLFILIQNLNKQGASAAGGAAVGASDFPLGDFSSIAAISTSVQSLSLSTVPPATANLPQSAAQSQFPAPANTAAADLLNETAAISLLA